MLSLPTPSWDPTQATFECVYCEVINVEMQKKHELCSIQCSLCSMKCAGVGEGVGAGAVCSVQCAVCSVKFAVGSVLPATGDD